MSMLNAIQEKNFTRLVSAATGWRFMPKSNDLAKANNRLHLTEMKGYSYGWWCYVCVIDGLLVFNKFPYSRTTQKHQSNMRSLLSKLGIRIDLEVSTKSSISQFTLDNVETCLRNELEYVQGQLAKCKRPKSAKRDQLQWQLEEIQSQLDHVASTKRSKLKLA